MNENISKWANYFTIFTNKLLIYKENREELLEKIQKLASTTNEEISFYNSDDGSILIDPLTILKYLTKKREKKEFYIFFKEVNNLFNISLEIPHTTISLFENDDDFFLKYDDEIEDIIENLWSLLAFANDYSNNSDPIIINEFVKIYDKISNYGCFNWDLTVFLYLVKPLTFISMDKNTRSYLIKKYSNLEYISFIKENCVPDGNRYISLCNKFQMFFEENDLNFSEIVFLANKSIIIKQTSISFVDFLNKKGYLFNQHMIENYLLSLKVKPFIILTGNSGTGKTKLSQLFAQFLELKLNYIDNYELVAVGANWTDNRNIIGYHNVITDEYQDTLTCKLIKRAKTDKNRPYFLILDEMNLSYVERYFADFLSALESGEAMNKPGTNSKFKLPNNLFVIGTVNVDETTYMFSPKVLDRSNVLEFNTIPVDNYMDMDKIDNIDETKDIEYLENPLEHKSLLKDEKGKDYIDIKYLKTICPEKLWLDLKIHLTDFHRILKQSGFDFGFRVTNEIISFILEAYFYENNDEFDYKRYLDAQILQKLLPKLHGSRNVIEDTLIELENYCKVNEFKNSYKKLNEMNKELETLRYVSFIN